MTTVPRNALHLSSFYLSFHFSFKKAFQFTMSYMFCVIITEMSPMGAISVLYDFFSLAFALMGNLQGKVFLNILMCLFILKKGKSGNE